MGDSKIIDKYQKIVVSILLLIIGGVAIILNTVDFSGHKLTIKENMVKVGVESFNIEDIQKIELLESINTVTRTKGTGTSKYIRGVCNIEGESKKASVYIYKNNSPYIRIELEEGLLIYNDKKSDDTKKTYDKLVDAINVNRETINE